MNLSAFAQQQGISYQTAWRRWQQVAVSARAASAETYTNLDRQADRVGAVGAAQGGQLATVVKACGSGAKDQRPQWLALLAETSLRHMVVEQNERCSRVGVASLQTLVQTHGQELVIITEADEGQGDLLMDVVAITTACCARRSGRRRARHKQTPLVAALEVTECASPAP
jgi:predicted site-specific integrase-resolvase